MKVLLHEDKKEVNRGCNIRELAYTISDFFQTKLLSIRNTIALMLTTAGSVMFGQHRVHTGQILYSFGSVSVDEVLQLINKMCSKLSPHDILLVSLLLCRCIRTSRCKNSQLVVIGQMFSTWISDVAGFNITQKRGLDCVDPAKYRPISNCIYLCRLTSIHCSQRTAAATQLRRRLLKSWITSMPVLITNS